MSARLPAVLTRFVLVAAVVMPASAAVTYAADQATAPPPPPAAPPAAPAAPAVLVVPDVRNQVYVFAKGTLEDAGFAWNVEGGVDGYAANLVAAQSPAPGTRLVDTGAPLVSLTLKRNASYPEEGDPENASPYPGTKLSLAGLAAEPLESAAAAPKPAAKSEAKPKPKPKPKAKAKPKAPAARPAAFAVASAPPEPLDEIPLDERARQLAAWVEKNPKPSDANVRHWLYQHNWIVTGARFGWFHGKEALETLVQVDRRVEKLWGVGTKSRVVAEQALAEVRERS